MQISTDNDVINRLQSMAEESLPPDYFEMWEKVKGCLQGNRASLNHDRHTPSDLKNLCLIECHGAFDAETWSVSLEGPNPVDPQNSFVAPSEFDARKLYDRLVLIRDTQSHEVVLDKYTPWAAFAVLERFMSTEEHGSRWCVYCHCRLSPKGSQKPRPHAMFCEVGKIEKSLDNSVPPAQPESS